MKWITEEIFIVTETQCSLLVSIDWQFQFIGLDLNYVSNYSSPFTSLLNMY